MVTFVVFVVAVLCYVLLPMHSLLILFIFAFRPLTLNGAITREGRQQQKTVFTYETKTISD